MPVFRQSLKYEFFSLNNRKDHAMSAEKQRKCLEQQIKDLQDRLDQAEMSALKSGKKIIQKLEHRVIF